MASDLGRHIESVALRLWGDPNASLSRGSQLRWGKNGARSVDTAKGVWSDHHGNHPSGVENGGVVALVMRELGLEAKEAVEWMRDEMRLDVGGGLVHSPGKANGKANGKHAAVGGPEKLVATYEYLDEVGALLYQAQRYERSVVGKDKPSKRFLQRRPDGNGGWSWKLGDVRLVPYRLPDLIEALALGRRVFVVEGEKAAEKLWSEGTPATTNAMGAGKWEDAFADFFVDASVSVLPDNDKDGRNHAVAVARSLSRTAASVNIIPLPGLAEKEDIVEWLDKRDGSIDRLHELAEAAPQFDPDAAPEAESKDPPPKPLVIINPALWAGRPAPARQWLVEHWIPQGVVTGLYGDGGIGKTLLLQQLQASAATGLPWLGLHVEECVSLGVYCEDSEDELHRRMEAIVTAYGCEYPRLKAMPMLARMGEDNLLMVFDSKGRGELTPFYQQVRELALDIRARFVGIDTASDTFGGNENDRGQVRQFVQRALGRLARDMSGSVVLLAHPSVAGMESGKGTGGNTGWNNTLRSRAYLSPLPSGDGEPPDPAARVLTRMKANYAPRDDAIELRWTKGVLALPAPISNAFRRPCEDVYLSLLTSCTASGNTPSPSFKAQTYAPTMFSKLPKAQREGYHKGEFERVQADLLNKKVIGFTEVGPPSRRYHVIVKLEPVSED